MSPDLLDRATGDPVEIDWEAVDEVMAQALAEPAFPGGVVAIGRHDGARIKAFGRQTYAPEARSVETDTIYDLASLTKVIATTTMAMMLVDRGRLDLEQPVVEVVPEFRGDRRERERVSVAHLLSHSAGFDGWAPLYQELAGGGRAAYLHCVATWPLGYEPGSRSVYSDLGFLLLGEVLERVSGRTLRAFVDEEILAAAGLTETGYCPDPSLLSRIAPTELDEHWRGRLVHGEVHDENTRVLGGVAPHAGLFGTAPDVARFARLLLGRGQLDGRRLVEAETVGRFTRRAGIPGSTRALGWDTPSDQGYTSAGRRLSALSYGHTGFTGTSIWVDPETDIFVVLLSNRVHPTRRNEGIRHVRPTLADAAVRALEA